MNSLFAADLHLTANKIDAYRWTIFTHLKKNANLYNVDCIFIAGDFVDRKDRHSGDLVNKIVDHIQELTEIAEVLILAGNHDAPIEGEYYWQFLNEIESVHYITKPVLYQDLFLLPFSPNPVRDWKELPLTKASAILMHQPVQGAFIDEYRKLDKAPVLPSLPDIPIFSGDIHNPQVLNNILYIGSPYPVHFNENWKVTRVILIQDSNYKNYRPLLVPTIKKSIIEIKSSDELLEYKFKRDDQLRIRVKLDGNSLSNWTLEEQKIRQWALEEEIHLTSLEPSIIGDPVKSEKEKSVEIIDPEQVIYQYAKQEKLSDDVLQMGLSLLRED